MCVRGSHVWSIASPFASVLCVRSHACHMCTPSGDVSQFLRRAPATVLMLWRAWVLLMCYTCVRRTFTEHTPVAITRTRSLHLEVTAAQLIPKPGEGKRIATHDTVTALPASGSCCCLSLRTHPPRPPVRSSLLMTSATRNDAGGNPGPRSRVLARLAAFVNRGGAGGDRSRFKVGREAKVGRGREGRPQRICACG